MRRGGHAYYALDLSDPDSPSLLWRIDKETPGFGELGQTWSEPVVTTIPGYVDGNGVHKPVLVFAAGYDTGKDASGVATPDGEGRGLYIVDAQTGALVWSVTPANNSTTNLSEPGLLHSVPAGVAVLDSNGDQAADRIYFGDTGGNLWRVDLSGNALPTSSQDTWQVNKLASFSGGSAASDRRFFNRPDVVRIRLDRSVVDAIIIGTGDRTNPNATDVDNRVYMIHDRETEPYSTVTPTASACLDPAIDYRCRLPLTEDGLYPIVEGTDVDEVALGAADGWRFELPYAGEKSLASSVTVGGKVFIPTYTPSDLFSDINSCVPQSGKGRLRVIDIYKGYLGAINLGPIIPDTPALYFDGNGDISVLLPPGAPEPPDCDEAGEGCPRPPVCPPGTTWPLCLIGEVPPPYTNYWFQEAY
jgi:type IV pilus assembly protein PilY1